MLYIEKKFPESVEKFKKVLAKPFIPERKTKMDRYGNAKEVYNPEGFLTPGKTYKRGVSGRSFWNLREYENKVVDYFNSKYLEFIKEHPMKDY